MRKVKGTPHINSLFVDDCKLKLAFLFRINTYIGFLVDLNFKMSPWTVSCSIEFPFFTTSTSKIESLVGLSQVGTKLGRINGIKQISFFRFVGKCWEFDGAAFKNPSFSWELLYLVCHTLRAHTLIQMYININNWNVFYFVEISLILWGIFLFCSLRQHLT